MLLLLVALLGVLLGAAARSTASPPIAADPIGVHSMLYLDTSIGAKDAMFKEAAALGASTIRLDISLSGVFENPAGPPDWTGVDQDMQLARRHHLRVLADLLGTPWYMVDCPAGTPLELTYRCPATDPSRWAEDAGEVAGHTNGAIDDFEIINEPDGHWAYFGTPRQYASTLSASYAAIHRANPHALVALGGLMQTGEGGRAWMNEVIAAAGGSVRHMFDIANVHVRAAPAIAGTVVCDWRSYFEAKGVTGPLWVTETGYPADPSQQPDPGYQGGAEAQARYLAAALPAMLRAGAAAVFVTERDALTGRYASEGVLDTTDPLTADPVYTRRPSFGVVRRLATGGWRTADRAAAGCRGNSLVGRAAPAR
jgi:hypothetical protein